MGGNPIKAWVIFITAWALLLIPLLRLTGQQTVPQTAAVNATKGDELSAWASLRFTQPPSSFTIKQGGKTLWSGKSTLETDTNLVFHVEHQVSELLVQAEWPDATGSQVIELTLEPEGLESVSQHVWAEGSLDEIMVFKWGAP